MRLIAIAIAGLLLCAWNGSVLAQSNACTQLKGTIETRLDCCEQAALSPACAALLRTYERRGCPEPLCAVPCGNTACSGLTEFCCSESCSLCLSSGTYCPPVACPEPK